MLVLLRVGSSGGWDSPCKKALPNLRGRLDSAATINMGDEPSNIHVSSPSIEPPGAQTTERVVSGMHEWYKSRLSASKKSNKTRHLRCSSRKRDFYH